MERNGDRKCRKRFKVTGYKRQWKNVAEQSIFDARTLTETAPLAIMKEKIQGISEEKT